jgi:hypothetical protein
MENNLTLFNLLHFNNTPLSDDEKKIFDFDQSIINRLISNLDRNVFYLGGQIKMTQNDIINLDSIEHAREIFRKREIEYGGPCNSFEAASVYQAKRELEFVENMIRKYNEIVQLRRNSYGVTENQL